MELLYNISVSCLEPYLQAKTFHDKFSYASTKNYFKYFIPLSNWNYNISVSCLESEIGFSLQPTHSKRSLNISHFVVFANRSIECLEPFFFLLKPF